MAVPKAVPQAVPCLHWGTYAPVYVAPGASVSTSSSGGPPGPGLRSRPRPVHLQVPGRLDRPSLGLGPLRPAAIRVPEGVETEAAIVDLKDQIGSLRKDLSNVRENVDQQLRRSEEQEQQLAKALRHRVNSLCSELADCGIEALKLCADLGHRPYGEAILRSRSAPGDRPCWRPLSRTASCASVLTPASAPVPRRVTGPAVMGASQIPTPFTPLMAPLSQLGRLGLSPRRVTAPAIPTASSAPNAPAPAAAVPTLAFTEPITALPGRSIQRAVNVLTAGGAPLTTGSRMNPAWRPAQPGAQPLSPKETLVSPAAVPGRWPSPTGRYLHRPFDQDSEILQAGDSSLKSSAENLLKLEDSIDESRVPRRTVQLPDGDLPPEVMQRLRKTAGSPRARKLREQLAAHREAKEAARQRSRSASAGRESKAMVPLREGSPQGQSAQWHKPGRIHNALKEPPAGAWSPRRPSRHWTSTGVTVTPRPRRATVPP